MSERDIVEKLRAPAYWMSGSNEVHEGENDAPRQAADEIDRLREQDEAIRAEFDQLSFFLSEWQTEAARLAAENEKLRARADVLLSKNNALTELCNSALSGDDLKAVDKHCDWVAFGHAYRAMLNVRRARTALQDKSDE
jgi:hypothetical protein